MSGFPRQPGFQGQNPPVSYENQPYDPSGFYNNPARSIPFPHAPNQPVAFWDSAEVSFSMLWSASGPNEPYRAVWRSPLFDLMPHVRSLGRQAPQNVLSIWKDGAPGTLFVWAQIQSPQPEISALAIEYGHPTDPTRANLAITRPTDVSSELTLDKGAALWPFSPPQGNLRFWQVELRFETILTAGELGPPPTSPRLLMAGYY